MVSTIAGTSGSRGYAYLRHGDIDRKSSASTPPDKLTVHTVYHLLNLKLDIVHSTQICKQAQGNRY